MLKSTALSIGCGGPESTYEHKDGKIYERVKQTNTSAYMLVYIRETERDEIMREVPIEEIPQHLKERFDEENSVNEKLEKDQAMLEECGTLYIISEETTKGWKESGVFQIPDDIYPWEEFTQNDEQRLKLKINKKHKIADLLTLLRRKTKYTVKDFQLYRVKYNKNFHCYEFNKVDINNLNQDIFGRTLGNSQTFYICHKEANNPILQRITNEERKVRESKYQKLIDFVVRRDLSKEFISSYKAKMKEVWRFINTESSSEDDISLVEISDDANDQNSLTALTNEDRT